MSKSFDYEEVFMGMTAGCSKTTHQQIFRDDYRLRFLTETIKKNRGKLLDIGCGGGTLTESLTHFYPRMDFFGCDISKNAINLARKFGSGKVSFSIIRNQKLPYKDNFFDVCLVLDVLEHVPDIHIFLTELKRVLKKNGFFYLVVPCESQFFTLTSLFQKIKIGNNLTYKHYGHIHPEFTHDYILGLLAGFKFELMDKRYSEHFFYQLVNFFQYFVPKELMELILGTKRASRYYDRSLVKSDGVINQKKDLMMLIRFLWTTINRLTYVITEFDTRILNRVGFSAWKVLLLAKNNK